MKQLVILLLLSLLGCHTGQVEPPEVKATILTYQPIGYVCDGGYTIQPETEAIYMARTTTLPLLVTISTRSDFPLPYGFVTRVQLRQ